MLQKLLVKTKQTDVRTKIQRQVTTYKTIFIDSFKRLYITVHEAYVGQKCWQ